MYIFLVIATSGVDYDIKLWEPTAESACSLETLSEVLYVCVCVCVCLRGYDGYIVHS